MEPVCKWCHRPIRVRVACRPRLYCSNACKQLAYRWKREETKRNRIRGQWQSYSKASQNHLERLLSQYGEEAAQIALDAIHQW